MRSAKLLAVSGLALMVGACSAAPQTFDGTQPPSAAVESPPVAAVASPPIAAGASPVTPGAEQSPLVQPIASALPTQPIASALPTHPTGSTDALFGQFSDVVVLGSATSGGGSRPLLEWQPVPGADHYGAYLYAPNGKIYWAWSGRQTSIHVGGEPQLRDGAPGPRVAPGMSWAVVAYDEDLLPIAVSELRAIEP